MALLSYFLEMTSQESSLVPLKLPKM